MFSAAKNNLGLVKKLELHECYIQAALSNIGVLTKTEMETQLP